MHKSVYYHVVMRLWRQHIEMTQNFKNQGEFRYTFADCYGVGAAARYVAWLCKGSDIYEDLPCILLKNA